MKHVSLAVLSASVLFSLFACHSDPAAPGTGLVQATANGCPFTTADQWQNFMGQTAEHEEWGDTCEDSTCNADFNGFVKSDIQGLLDKCETLIGQNPKIAACTANLRLFLPTWVQQHTDHSFGFTLDNASYYTYEEGPAKPSGLMTPPPTILAAIPDRAKIEAAAQAAGLKYLVHTSCLGGVRIFVNVPDPQGRFDQWILLNLDSKNQTVDTGIPMSFIGVQKKDANGNPLAHVRLNFRDYFLEKNGAGAYAVQSFADSNGKCFSCHLSGTRQLMYTDRQPFVMSAKPVLGDANYDPKAADLPDIGPSRWQEFNTKLASYGLPDWDGTIKLEANGPALGKEQGCTACHNGVTRGALTINTSTSQLDQKLWQELAMPPDDPTLPGLLARKQTGNPALTADETKKLKDAQDAHDTIETDFMAARLPTLRQWLLQTSCN